MRSLFRFSFRKVLLLLLFVGLLLRLVASSVWREQAESDFQPAMAHREFLSRASLASP